MKTTVKSVTVEMLVDGHRTFHVYSIVTGSGDLMTKRLQKLLDGSIADSYQRRHDTPDVQFIGAIWSAPYQLLKEITDDRKALQRELFQMEGLTDLTEYPMLGIPMKECSHKISELMETELKLRKQLKTRIRELDRIKAEHDAELETPGFVCSDWGLGDARTARKPIMPSMPTPYSW